MDWPRKLGVFFVLAGTLLLSVYLLPTLYGTAMSHIAIAEFRAQSSTNSLWDSSRILAYKHTLDISLAPPEAILSVPRLGIEVPVLEGTSDATMNRGVGHIPGTALPGERGNLAITGHRDGFFRPLKDVIPGDIIEVRRQSARNVQSGQPAGPIAQQTDRYVVRNIRIVRPSDTYVLSRTSDSTLTLVTCYPFYYVGAAPQRFIVQATLLSALPVTSDAAQFNAGYPSIQSTLQPILGE